MHQKHFYRSADTARVASLVIECRVSRAADGAAVRTIAHEIASEVRSVYGPDTRTRVVFKYNARRAGERAVYSIPRPE
jgi:hypothetical protein